MTLPKEEGDISETNYLCMFSLRGDVKRNINKAIGYSRHVSCQGWYSLGTSYHFTQFLDDETIEEERNAGIDMGLELLNICDELWQISGDKISVGMLNEIGEGQVTRD